MTKVLIINGPNLQNIGEREPLFYGNISFNDYLSYLNDYFEQETIEYYQSNYESEIINTLYEAQEKYDAIILNAGGFSHSSVAIRDAISNINIPVVMVHISNVYAREGFRKNNLIAPVCKGVITGFELDSYRLAILSFLKT